MPDGDFEHKSALQSAYRVGTIAGVAGIFVSTVQNAFANHSRGAFGVITRSGGTIGFFAVMGATFAFTETFVANSRRTDDAVNGAAAGCAAGFLGGLRAGSLPSAVGGCVFFGAAMGAFDHMGGLNGPPKHVIQKPFFKEQDLVARVKSEINELDKV